ncbi:hypothetical protein BGZ96_003088 [Linnemannia gamsii]|uniref:F-box domain-containing protein n=1 Tax=Linnemannia gamsii TaxID=64522 RepID=A0ABQ7KA84_9FUNG|nr:hypothetical protein BGZ96_003088 [Linnemannia gamsii]
MLKVIRSEFLFGKTIAHLNRTDLSQCALVNRYWNSLFWHTHFFSEDSHSEEPFHKNHRVILNQLSLYIRQWYSHDCRSLLFFNGPQSRCRHLRELEFIACLAHESTTQAAQLIQFSPMLERLTIRGDFTLTQNSETPQNLFSALLQHPVLQHPVLTHLQLALRHLSINTKMMDQTHEQFLFPLLRRCPKLREASISYINEWITSPPLPSRPTYELVVLLRDHYPKTKFVIWPDKVWCDINGVVPQDCSGLKLFETTRTRWFCLDLG